MINNIINKYKNRKEDVYILFADIEKCFDNLWLKDCIIELVRNGFPIEEAMYIFIMNMKVKAIVRTPVTDTEEIHLEEIVRQGTVGGNKLCVVSTDRINKMGSFNQCEKDTRYPLFVDDMAAIGSKECLKEMNEKMKILETTKKYKFNIKKVRRNG